MVMQPAADWHCLVVKLLQAGPQVDEVPSHRQAALAWHTDCWLAKASLQLAVQLVPVQMQALTVLHIASVWYWVTAQLYTQLLRGLTTQLAWEVQLAADWRPQELPHVPASSVHVGLEVQDAAPRTAHFP
jgi:hypothetical protein